MRKTAGVTSRLPAWLTLSLASRVKTCVSESVQCLILQPLAQDLRFQAWYISMIS